MNDTVVINLGNAGPHQSGDLFVLEEKLWLTEDKTEAVPDGDARARFLLGLPGDEIPFEVAVACGLAEAERKKRTPSKNKMKTPENNKSGDDNDGEG